MAVVLDLHPAPSLARLGSYLAPSLAHLGPHPALGSTLAYIDPGVGAMLMQLAVGAFFGLLFYLRSVRQYVARLFGRAKDRSK
jgi:hypothetical protein